MARLRIFISYRRDDLQGLAQGIVGRIHDRLEDHYGTGQVFMDIDAIPPGANFVEYLGSWVAKADVLLAVIGPQWAELLQARRDDPRDFVRIEIEEALRRGIPVVPLLLRGARMPGPETLTGSLARLGEHQAVAVDEGRDFKAHLARLIRDLDTHYRPGARRPPEPLRKPRPAPAPKPEPKPRDGAKPPSPRPTQKPTTLERTAGTRRGCLMAAGVALLAIVAVWPQGNPVPVPPPVEASPFPPGQATQESPYRNTLGMRFVPVPGADILMAVWETRAGDYAACAAEESGVDRAWRSGATAPDLPVVNVSWEDARAFCAWLSRKEGRTYRLPSDHEWSLAVGIGDREDAKASPAEKDMKIRDVYPWGTEWPPPSGAGNYGLIPGFSDPHSGLAPVGSYRPNALGIFDLGGNVWEWVGDTWEPTSSSRVVRGASWLQYGPGHLLSSYRNLDVPTRRLTYNGFRVVLEVGEGER